MTLIRPAADADLTALTAIYNHYIETSAATFDIRAFSTERRRAEWFNKHAPSGPHRVFVADDAGRVLGFAYSGAFRSKQAYETTVETSVYCAQGETGRGLGGKLYQALFDALASEDLEQAFALITLPNEPSEELHRRFGFERVGVLRSVGRKFDQLWDVALYQRPIRLES